MDMKNFVAAIIIMMSLFVATFQVIRILKYRELSEPRHRLLAILMYLESALILSDLFSGGSESGFRFIVDEMLMMIPLMLLSSSMWSISRSIRIVRFVISVMVLLTIYHILCAFSLVECLSPETFRWIFAVSVLSFVVLFLLGIWYRVRAVRAVIQAGTVWSSLSFVVDAAYVTFVLSEVIFLNVAGAVSVYVIYATVILISLTASAYGIRIASDSLFVFHRRHERRIVESMKISSVEQTGSVAREDDLFKSIYDRVLEYFETDKPFLNGDLTINDIVSVVYTNKLYISRAISQYTGRNFCQFVNYHRVMYSVECFRKNPELKVAELWPMCGFNTIVSFNMAFRLFMGENPSDWCRKEKVRLSRKRK